MKCTSISLVLVSVFVLVVVASCGRRESTDVRKPGAEQPADGTIVLAVVGGRRITLADFEAESARRGATGHRQSEEQRRKLLDELIAFEVLLARAKAAGFDRTPAMQNQIDQLIVARFQEEQFASQPPLSRPAEADLRAFYESHTAQFTKPAEVRAGLIFFSCSSKATPEKRAQLRQVANAVLEEARRTDSTAFTALVQKHSTDQATRYRGGDTGWLRVGDEASAWPAGVMQAAAELSRPGECASLVETPTGFYIVRLLERNPGGTRAFDEVKAAIAYQVEQQQRERRQQDFLQEMKRGIQIEDHSENLRRLPKIEQAAEAAPPPVPKS